jgi:hypothetical protein
MEIDPHVRKRTIRNLSIFCLVTLGAGFAGIAIDRLAPPADPMQGLGALLWLAAPLVANLLLRWLGRDGWRDLGLAPRFRPAWAGYLAALLLIPAVTLLALAPGRLVGSVSLAGFAVPGSWSAYLSLVLAAGLAALVKNIFEEFAWRGYLTPRFAALGLNPYASALLTGVVWAGWHVPYYLHFLNPAVLTAHTSLPVTAFLALAFCVLPLQAFAYGELRLLTRSVWPAWLLHTLANAISLPLLSDGFVTLSGGPAGVFFSPGSEGVLYSLLMGLTGYLLYRYRQSKMNTEVNHVNRHTAQPGLPG